MNEYMLTIKRAPISYPIYSSFSYFAPYKERELPGTWLVAALGSLGFRVGSVRQTLYRMEQNKELLSRQIGRIKYYRISPYVRSELYLAMSKLSGEQQDEWDRSWTIVHFSFSSKQQIRRDQFRNYIKHAGFAELGRSVYIHPGLRTARVKQVAKSLGVEDHVAIFQGSWESTPCDSTLVETLWDITGLRRRYLRFITKYRRLICRENSSIALKDAFVFRFALVFDFLEIAWKDPELPPELLPSNWPGNTAQQLAYKLYQNLMPAALGFAEQLYEEVVRVNKATSKSRHASRLRLHNEYT